MSKEDKLHGFPDVESKLTAPTKKSIFERQKEQAEAKRLKEQKETAAVYQDFVKSFDDEGSDDDAGRPRLKSEFRGAAPSSGLSKRHFSTNLPGPGAGRGARFSGPGSLGPTQSAFTKKRTYEGSLPLGMRTFEDAGNDSKNAFPMSDDEEEVKTSSRAEERAKQKPTIHMSSLPPTISATAIRAVLPSTLTIDSVRIAGAVASSSGERRSASAIVTLAADTPASDLDTAVSALQNRYLGRGFYLSLSRHLSSAVITSNLPGPSTVNLPFGAKATPQTIGRGQFPPRGGGGFAPPPSLTPRGAQAGRPPPGVQVNVIPPSDLKQLKLIHKMLELVVTNGPEFEALLMSRPEVQNEERWAWLWDSTSTGGVWYRWRLWEMLTRGHDRSRIGLKKNDTQHIFQSSAPWVTQDRKLPFEYITELDDFVTDSEYNSSEEEDSGDEGRRRLQHLQGGPMPSDTPAAGPDDGPSYLNPLRKAKLVHLLSRLPETNAKLRRGDVARITAFAIQNAGNGADEVVDLLVTNVHAPFAQTSKSGPNARDADNRPDVENVKLAPADDVDPAALKLVALYCISDILSSSSTSGVRHAWRYRQLFETALAKRNTFAHLGRLEKQLAWGRLRAEKWRRAIGAIHNLWEGWSVFTAAGHAAFVELFARPPLTEAEQAQAAQAEEFTNSEKAKGRWKTVAERGDEDHEAAAEDVDGEPMDEDEDLDGVSMESSDEEVDGNPIREDDASPMETSQGPEAEQEPEASEEPAEQPPAKESGPGPQRGRAKAADMFGDSDDD